MENTNEINAQAGYMVVCEDGHGPLTTHPVSYPEATAIRSKHRRPNHTRIRIDTVTTRPDFHAVNDIVNDLLKITDHYVEPAEMDFANENKFIEYNITLPEGEIFVFAIEHSTERSEELPVCTIRGTALTNIADTSGSYFANKTLQMNIILERLRQHSSQLNSAFRTKE